MVTVSRGMGLGGVGKERRKLRAFFSHVTLPQPSCPKRREANFSEIWKHAWKKKREQLRDESKGYGQCGVHLTFHFLS